MMLQNQSNLMDFTEKDDKGLGNNDDRRRHFYKGLKDTEFHQYYDWLNQTLKYRDEKEQ